MTRYLCGADTLPFFALGNLLGRFRSRVLSHQSIVEDCRVPSAQRLVDDLTPVHSIVILNIGVDFFKHVWIDGYSDPWWRSLGPAVLLGDYKTYDTFASIKRPVEPDVD